MEFVNKPFENENITLDGNSYLRCKFKNCHLIYGGGAITIEGCSFVDVSWGFDGDAARAILFMRSIYHMGEDGRTTIESTFDKIRGKPMSDEKKSTVSGNIVIGAETGVTVSKGTNVNENLILDTKTAVNVRDEKEQLSSNEESWVNWLVKPVIVKVLGGVILAVLVFFTYDHFLSEVSSTDAANHTSSSSVETVNN